MATTVVSDIDKRLDEIDREITRLHILKLEHRKPDYKKNVRRCKELGMIRVSHCYQCEMWTYEQKNLRMERKALIVKRRMVLDAAN